MNEGYEDVLQSIASSEPTPGGGSVAALSLAHAHSLAIMVARLTVGKEKWSDGHEAAESVISNSHTGLGVALQLAENDAAAFETVMSAYRLPRNSDEDKENRAKAIREATIGAAEAPLETATEALELLSDIEALCHSCNSNALTDLASAAELSHTAVIIASMNVRINLDFIKGEDVDRISSCIGEVLVGSSNSLERIRSMVSERLGWQ
tara:strand:+ start:2667 stop:3290 length:624 start_codon:yes stop_codon:yes gene_type:complete